MSFVLKASRKKMFKVFSFQKQLKVGNKGESQFLEFYNKEKPIKSINRDFDFLLGDKKVELKTDTYSGTENFFIEKIGSNVTNKKGSVWFCVEKEIDFFVYFFIKTKTFYWFNPKILSSFLDKTIDNYETRRVQNYTWHSIGYLVPIKDIEHLVIKKDIING